MSYDWNYQNPPAPVDMIVPHISGQWSFCGLPVASPLGVAAGPLLNGAWCLYYASLGFDVLTYKTVRSATRACYPMPNLLPVDCGSLMGGESIVPAAAEMRGSWAVSFGMPSQPPDVWRADIERTRGRLAAGKILSVSVVGTVQPGWSINDLAADYARCAQWALDSGADSIEANLSCPNVTTCDGQLYQQPAEAAIVAEALRDACGCSPLIIKVGQLANENTAGQLIAAIAAYIDAISMTNSIAVQVRDNSGEPLFDGQRRGICGRATLEASIAQVRMISRIVDQRGLALQLIGVGGASTAEDVKRYLDAGAHAVHLATAAMQQPDVAIQIRRDWQKTP
jgi:dihydroorotate dehydrogenase